MESSSNKTVTIRRRLASLTAILNYAYAELDLDKRNPFRSHDLQSKGNDSLKRGVFTNDNSSQDMARESSQLRQIFSASIG